MLRSGTGASAPVETHCKICLLLPSKEGKREKHNFSPRRTHSKSLSFSPYPSFCTHLPFLPPLCNAKSNKRGQADSEAACSTKCRPTQSIHTDCGGKNHNSLYKVHTPSPLSPSTTMQPSLPRGSVAPRFPSPIPWQRKPGDSEKGGKRERGVGKKLTTWTTILDLCLIRHPMKETMARGPSLCRMDPPTLPHHQWIRPR